MTDIPLSMNYIALRLVKQERIGQSPGLGRASVIICHTMHRITQVWVCLVTALPAWAAGGVSCESLRTLALPDTTITRAEPVAAGGFSLPEGAVRPGQMAPDFSRLPGYCRVAATLAPSKDSDIKIEVWLPAESWNGKFQAVGNGGWSGNIVYPALARALERGYATASTDTGHSGGSGSFALGHPEKLIDFGHRAVHEMTVKAKAIIAAYYGGGPKISYWNGCSSGGKQGLKEAQRYPADYDGIVAGAPANYWTHLMAADLWVALAAHKDEASFIPSSKFQLIHKAVLNACDALDGVKDGVIEDPRRCHFDPEVLACKGADTGECLSAPQVETVRKIYTPAKNPRTGREIYPPMEPGSELGWGALAGAQPFMIAFDHFRYVVFKNPEWDWRTLNFDSDVALADKLDNGLLNATDPNLEAFVKHGGKLLLYHGWNDQLIAPRNAINYYNSVVDKVGSDKAADSIRLFMAPGMTHCSGGEGPFAFDPMSLIEPWVEKGKAPDRIVAAHLTQGKPDRTRPLCPYPQTAQYTGSGSSDDASNFVCKAQ
jgi:feruloyl esterase